MALTGTELVVVTAVTAIGSPAATTEQTTTQAIANLSGGGGGIGAGITVTSVSGTYPLDPTRFKTNFKLISPSGISMSVNPATMTIWATYTAKDAAGNAGTYPITLTPSSGTIDGGANYTVANNYDSVDFYSDGTNVYTK